MNFTIEMYEPCCRGGGSVVRRHAQGRHGRAGQRVLPVLVAVRLGVDPWAILIAERRSVPTVVVVAVGVRVSVGIGATATASDASTDASTEDVTDRSSPEES